jgi:hypothetical protein
MKLRNLLMINALIAFAYGISYQVAPKTILSLYGVAQGPDEVFLSRLFGAALIGISLLTWFVRDISHSETKQAVVLSMLVYDIIGVIVAVHATVSGVMNAVGWTGVAVFSFLALGYAYFQFVNPRAT